MLAVSLSTYETLGDAEAFNAGHAADIARLIDMPPKELMRRVNAADRSCCSSAGSMPTPPPRSPTRASRASRSCTDTKRFYPKGESAAHVVWLHEQRGRTARRHRARGQFAPDGRTGPARGIRDRLGRVILGIGEAELPLNGETIQLTIDRRIQQLAHTLLKAAIVRHRRACAGSVVMLDARATARFSTARNYP